MKNLYKNKKLLLGTLIPIVFSLILLYLYLPAFNNIDENVDEIIVLMVNEDTDIGEEVSRQIEKNAPFTLIEETSIDNAMKQLEDKEAHMIIEIPKDFTSQLKKGNSEITYIIDEARQTAIKSAMEDATKEITQLLNENAYEITKRKTLAGIEEFYLNIESTIPKNEPLLQSKEVVIQAIEGLKYKSISENTLKINENNHRLNTVLPLLIFLTIFVSALIRSFLYEKEVMPIQVELSAWPIFFHKQLLNIVASMLYPLAIILVLNTFDVKITANYVTLWLFLTITFYMFSVFIQAFLDLFSFIGIGILIILLLFQVLTSGIILPIELVTKYYTWASPFLPATYFTDGLFGIFYTNTSIWNAIFALTIFGVIAIIVSLIYVTILQRRKKVKL
ncbi:YhgE/Pip domain-containing protein [Pueribacillus theae]|nr:ABC transporter permease [Pueribacillus theae]